MLKAVYCGLALGLLAAMAWAKAPAPRCRSAHLRQLAWAVDEGQVTPGRASVLAEAATACPAMRPATPQASAHKPVLQPALTPQHGTERY
jgi:hypothetical protein